MVKAQPSQDLKRKEDLYYSKPKTAELRKSQMGKVSAMSKDIKKKKIASKKAKATLKNPFDYFDKVKKPFTRYKSLLEIPATDIDGNKIEKLGDILQGKELILVTVGLPTNPAYNVFGLHHSALNEIYKRLGDKGLEILAFPCDQFDDEEPGTNA